MKKATLQNTELLLQTIKGSLLGDPYFGNSLKKYLFEPNNYILKDIIIDTLYSQIALFLPQIKVNRNDINIIKDTIKGKLICKFTGINQIDYKVDTFNLVLLTSSDN